MTYGDPVPSAPESVAAAKALLRQPLIAARRARNQAQRAAARDAVAARLTAKLSGAAAVAGYLPLPTEPFTARVLDALVAAGTRVIVRVPLDGVRTVIGGVVQRSRRPGHRARVAGWHSEVAVAFDDPDLHGDLLRATVIRMQLRARRLAPPGSR